MSLATLLSRDVMILTGTATTDRYNDTVLDWSAPTSRSAKAWFAQQDTSDDHEHRNAKITEGTVTFEVSAALAADERVVIDDTTYEVVGTPNVARTPRGPHHIEARLRVVLG